MLSHAGDQHELEFVRTLEVAGSNVANLKDRDFASTLQAMQLGLEVIYQARLEGDEFAGYADFLLRVEGSSQLGPYEYEVWDTKLARSPKPYFVIQLCCYAEMIESIQGCLPTYIGVVLGNARRERFRTADYISYYRAVKRAFIAQQSAFDPEQPPCSPECRTTAGGTGTWGAYWRTVTIYRL